MNSTLQTIQEMHSQQQFTVSDVVQEATVGKDTVYRTVEILEETDVVERVNQKQPAEYKWK